MSVGGLSFCAAAQLWHIIMNLSAKNQKSEGKKMWKLTPAQVKQRNKMEKQETERKSEKQQWKIREKLDDGMEKQRQSRKRMARKQCKTPNLEPVQCSLRCAFAAFRIKTGSLWLDILFSFTSLLLLMVLLSLLHFSTISRSFPLIRSCNSYEFLLVFTKSTIEIVFCAVSVVKT